MRETEAAGRRSGAQLLFLEASSPNEFDAAFAAMRREGIRALLMLGDPLFVLHREVLAELISEDRLLAVSGYREFGNAGGHEPFPRELRPLASPQ